MLPALTHGFLITGPPGKSYYYYFCCCAIWHVVSSLTRDQTLFPALELETQSLSHWTTRNVLFIYFFLIIVFFVCVVGA